MLYFSRSSSLSNILRRTSHLTYCDEFIRFKRDHGNKQLPVTLHNWVMDMFTIGPDRHYDDDIGRIAHWMRFKYTELFDDILELSSKIETQSGEITNTDWDLIQNGIEQYRRHLLNQTFDCDCF